MNLISKGNINLSFDKCYINNTEITSEWRGSSSPCGIIRAITLLVFLDIMYISHAYTFIHLVGQFLLFPHVSIVLALLHFSFKCRKSLTIIHVFIQTRGTWLLISHGDFASTFEAWRLYLAVKRWGIFSGPQECKSGPWHTAKHISYALL